MSAACADSVPLATLTAQPAAINFMARETNPLITTLHYEIYRPAGVSCPHGYEIATFSDKIYREF
jgi:hypothetical protein